MGKFLDSEKLDQIKFKLTSPTISSGARSNGFYRTKFRLFCLPVEFSSENLFPQIRESAARFFKEHKVKWHDGLEGNPSNHLCDSQVSCVNFLFPFANQPLALAQILKPFYTELDHMLPIEGGQYVTFEWIGEKNYLGERVPKDETRTRGANCTSADAAVMFERLDGKRHVVLIEWKYTESYSPISLAIAKSGTSRVEIYRHLIDAPDCPFDTEFLTSFEDLFYEPFYQFMRQQFLAHEMEKAGELGANFVSVLHISPAANEDFKRITSEKLLHLGKSATEVWSNLVKPRERFSAVQTEQLFERIIRTPFPEMRDWSDYIQKRYIWMR